MAKQSSKELLKRGQGSSILHRVGRDELTKVQTDKPKLSLQHGALIQIPLDSLQPDQSQPRKHFDHTTLSELAQSIAKHGVLEPILVRSDDNEGIVIVAGERRWRAAKEAGLAEVPCIATSGNPDEISLIENLHRENLKPIEEAEAYARMIEKYNYTQDQLADIIHKDRSTVTSILVLNKLPEQIKAECRTEGLFSKRTLIEIARQKSERQMLSLYNKAKKSTLTSDEVRNIVRKKSEQTLSDKVDRAANNAAGLRKVLDKLMSERGDEQVRVRLLKELQQLQDVIERFLN